MLHHTASIFQGNLATVNGSYLSSAHKKSFCQYNTDFWINRYLDKMDKMSTLGNLKRNLEKRKMQTSEKAGRKVKPPKRDCGQKYRKRRNYNRPVII